MTIATTQICLIAALAENRVIGINNSLPWHLSADLKRFRKITMGKPIVMGRKTFDSIGRPLPGRTNVIISRNHQYKQEGCMVCSSLEAALEKLKDHPVFMVIGGRKPLRNLLSHCSAVLFNSDTSSFRRRSVFSRP